MANPQKQYIHGSISVHQRSLRQMYIFLRFHYEDMPRNLLRRGLPQRQKGAVYELRPLPSQEGFPERADVCGGRGK